MNRRSWLWMGIAVLAVGRVGWAEDQAVKTDSFDSAGVKISYMEAGAGEPVILVHGLYSSAAMNWKMPGTFDLLAKNHRVVALDLRGHGQSDKPAGEEAYGQPMVEDITRLMDHLKIEKAHVVGYSLGGMVAMKFVVDHPERVMSLTLGGMGWLKKGSVEAGIFERMGGRGGAGREGGLGGVGGLGGGERTPAACVHGIAKLGVTEEEVKGVKVPMRVLVGTKDPCEKLYVEPLKRIRPDVEVTEIEGAGHITCVMNKEFKEGVGKWIDGQKGAAGKAAGAEAATKPK